MNLDDNDFYHAKLTANSTETPDATLIAVTYEGDLRNFDDPAYLDMLTKAFTRRLTLLTVMHSDASDDPPQRI